ncbi:MAG: alpha/beta hydrolase [Thermoleophilia bacterium]
MGAPCTCRTADGVELRGTVAGGEGPGVLLIHGLASNARMWDGVIAVLEEQGRAVAAFDMRGHGQSEQTDDGYTIDQLAADVAVIIAQLSADDPVWQAPIVAGQSLGGNVVLALAASGTTVSGIVLVDGGFIDLAANYSTWPECAAALSPPDLTHLTPADLLAMLQKHFPDSSDMAIAGVAIAGMAACWGEVDGHITPYLTREHHMALLRSLYDSPPNLYAERVTVPTTIVTADCADTDSVKKATVERLAAVLPNCRCLWHGHAHHDIHAEHPREIAAIILGSDA